MNDRKFTPQFPKLFREPGPRCEKLTHRSHGLISLQCVRRVHGREVNHLMDIMDRDAVEGAR